MSASRWLGYAAGAGALSYGAYFAVQQKEVMKLEKEATDLTALVEKEKKKIAQSASLIAEAEARMEALSKQEVTVKGELTKAQEQLEAAKQKVHRLQADHTKVVNERGGLLARLTSLSSDSERSKEAMALSEKSLAIARVKAAEAKQLLNPLNHPALAGSKGGKR